MGILNVMIGGQWERPEDRRRFFEDLAKEHGFNSQDVNHWYHVSTKNIISRKVCVGLLISFCLLFYYQGSSSVLVHHEGNFKKALIELYPNLPFNIALFSK